MYAPDALLKLVNTFHNDEIGGVCGELIYEDTDHNVRDSNSESIYWKYEKWIKRNESRLAEVIVFNGSIYAIRRSLHQPMNIQAANDFQHPISILLQGYKNIYQPEAIAYEKITNNEYVEFKRHVRITLRGWKGLAAYPQILNPFRVGFTSIHFAFRKMLRWLSPLFILTLFALNIFLLNENIVYQFMFILQIIFCALSAIGLFLTRLGYKTVLSSFYYFFLVNIALFVALVKYLSRYDSSVWTPTTHMK